MQTLLRLTLLLLATAMPFATVSGQEEEPSPLEEAQHLATALAELPSSDRAGLTRLHGELGELLGALVGEFAAGERPEDGDTLVRLIFGCGNNLESIDRNDLARGIWKLGTDLEHGHQPYIRLRMAETFRADQRWDEAYHWLRETEAAGRTITLVDPDHFHFYLGCERSSYHLDLGLLDLARADLEEATELAAKQESSSRIRWKLLVTWLDYFLATDQFDRMELAVEEFLRGGPDSSYVNRVKFRLGVSRTERSRLEPGHREQAILSLEEALEGSASGGGLGPEKLLSIELRLLGLKLEAGDLEGAATWLRRADASLKTIRDDDGDLRVGLLVERDTLAGALTVFGDAPREEKERALDLMRGAYDRLLVELRSIPPRPGGCGFLYYSEDRLILELLLRARLHLDASPRGIERALEELMRVQTLGSLTRRLEAAEVPSVEEVRETLLRPDHGLLVYYPSTVRSLVFAVDSERVAVAELDSWLILRGLRRRFLDEVEWPPGREVEAARPGEEARAMARALLPESLQAMVGEWEAITVVGLDLLGGIPFASLPFPGDRPLGLELAVDSLPSIPLAMALVEREKERGPIDGILFLAAPTPHPRVREELHLLPLDLQPPAELHQAMSEVVAGRSLRVHHGSEATKARVTGGALSGLALLHIFTHGVFDPGDDPLRLRERPAGLMFAPGDEDDDGLLWCQDVEQLVAAPPVVLLSACSAAAGPARIGDDCVSHLGGAFLSAGARAVVLSRADLDYHATLALTTRFTEHFAQGGISPARALQLARRDLVADHPEWTHPYYHGLLEVLGLGQLPVTMPELEPGEPERSVWPSGPAVGVVVACFALLLAGGFARRRRSGPG